MNPNFEEILSELSNIELTGVSSHKGNHDMAVPQNLTINKKCFGVLTIATSKHFVHHRTNKRQKRGEIFLDCY